MKSEVLGNLQGVGLSGGVNVSAPQPAAPAPYDHKRPFRTLPDLGAPVRVMPEVSRSREYSVSPLRLQRRGTLSLILIGTFSTSRTGSFSRQHEDACSYDCRFSPRCQRPRPAREARQVSGRHRDGLTRSRQPDWWTE